MRHIAGVIGSRSLPESFSPLVHLIVSHLLSLGYDIASGGAMGADSFVLTSLLRERAAHRGIVYAAWQHSASFPTPVQQQIAQLSADGGRVFYGHAISGDPRQEIVSALLARNRRLVSACAILVTFIYGASRGTGYTMRQAASRDIPVIAFRCG